MLERRSIVSAQGVIVSVDNHTRQNCYIFICISIILYQVYDSDTYDEAERAASSMLEISSIVSAQVSLCLLITIQNNNVIFLCAFKFLCIL